MSSTQNDATAVSLTATAADEVAALLREADAILNQNAEIIDSSMPIYRDGIVPNTNETSQHGLLAEPQPPMISTTKADEVLSAVNMTLCTTKSKTVCPKSIMKPSTTPSTPHSASAPSNNQLMKLEASQTTYSKYPIDCRVHYNFNQVSPTTTSTSPSQSRPKLIGSYCVGRIQSVFLDTSSKNFVYEVAPIPKSGHTTTEMLTESQLAYASGTPVCVQFSEREAVQDGEIVGCKVDLEDVKMYSVQLSMYKNIAQLYEDVHESMITHRKLSKKVEASAAAASAAVNKSTIGLTTSQKVEAKKARVAKKKTISKAKLQVPKKQKSPAILAARRERRALRKIAKRNAKNIVQVSAAAPNQNEGDGKDEVMST